MNDVQRRSPTGVPPSRGVYGISTTAMKRPSGLSARVS
jgi:hypothetical protein